MKKTPRGRAGAPLCLGMLVVPEPGKLAEMTRSLERDGRLELGTAEDHRVTACAVTQFGEDEALLRAIAKLPAVLSVEVVYAEILDEEIA